MTFVQKTHIIPIMDLEQNINKEIETMEKLESFLNFMPSFFKSETLTERVKEVLPNFVIKLALDVSIITKTNFLISFRQLWGKP